MPEEDYEIETGDSQQLDPESTRRVQQAILAGLQGLHRTEPAHIAAPFNPLSRIIINRPPASARTLPQGASIAALAQQWLNHHMPTNEIEEISALAADVLEDAEQGVRWLSTPNLATDNRAPIELIGEKDGFERVKNLLMRIEYGVLA